MGGLARTARGVLVRQAQTVSGSALQPVSISTQQELKSPPEKKSSGGQVWGMSHASQYNTREIENLRLDKGKSL